MSTEERNKAIIRQMYTELFTQGKLSLAEELFAADYIDQEAPPGQSNRGPESMRQLVTMFHTAFPDITFHVEEVIAEGETVAARVFWTGTHHGTFLGIAPTGRAARRRAAARSGSPRPRRPSPRRCRASSRRPPRRPPPTGNGSSCRPRRRSRPARTATR